MRIIILVVSIFVYLDLFSFSYTTDFSDTASAISGEYTKVFYTDSVYYVFGYDSAEYVDKYSLSGSLINRKFLSDCSFPKYYTSYQKVIKTTTGFLYYRNYGDTNSVRFSYLVALDNNIDTVWTRYLYSDSTFNIYNNLSIVDIRQTPDGGYLVGGYSSEGTHHYTKQEAFLLKLSSIGKKQWGKRYPFVTTMECMELTPDLGILVYCEFNGHSYMLKTTSLGNIQWKKEIKKRLYWGGSADLKYGGNNNFVLVRGASFTDDDDPNYYYCGVNLIKINCITGSFIFDTINRPYHDFTTYRSFKLNILDNGNILVAGNTYSPLNTPHPSGICKTKGAVIMYNLNGDSIWSHIFEMPPFYSANENDIYDLKLMPDGSFIGCGDHFEELLQSCYKRPWIFKYTPPWVTNIDEVKKNKISLKCYPNPTYDKCNISFSGEASTKYSYGIYCNNGKLIMHDNIPKNAKQFSINLGNYPKGVYFIKVITKEEIIGSQKIIKQ